MKRLARKTDSKFTSAPLTSDPGSKAAVKAMAKAIDAEFRAVCRHTHDTLLKDGLEAVKQFSWETVWYELHAVVPTLMSLLKKLVRRPQEHKQFISFVASMLLKKRSNNLGLVQRAITVALYGNGAHKAVCGVRYTIVVCNVILFVCMQVYRCLQPLMVSYSASGCIKLIDRLSEDHDIEVKFWCDELKDNFMVITLIASYVCHINNIMYCNRL